MDGPSGPPYTTVTMSNPVNIQTTLEQRNITLQVNTSDHSVADVLLGLLGITMGHR